MAGVHVESGRSIGERPAEGSAVANVHYTFPENGWTVEKIAPIPPESRFVVGGREITHIVLGHPFGAGIKLTQGVDQDTANEILEAGNRK